MEEIIINDDVIIFLKELVYKLYTKEYFGFVDSAEDYVNNISDFVFAELPNVKHRKTPKELQKYGDYYTMYRANKRTAWYVFFNKKGNRYVIEYITNNHVAKAAFIKGLK